MEGRISDELEMDSEPGELISLERYESPYERPDRRRSSASAISPLTDEPAPMFTKRLRPSVSSAASQLATVLERRTTPARRATTSVSSGSGSSPSVAGPRHSSAEATVSTKKALKNFAEVIARENADPEAARRKLERLNQFNAAYQNQRRTIKSLVKWADYDNRRTIDWLLSFTLRRFRQSPLPDDQKLIELAQYLYPPRGHLKAHVCDFGDNRAEYVEITVDQIEEYSAWQGKPDWAIVRWIHAPLGIGLTHSSVEDMFLHEPPADAPSGREFENGGTPGWPYLEMETLNFRAKQNFQEMRDVLLLLSKDPKLAHLKPRLDQLTWESLKNKNLLQDILWRADHVSGSTAYWDMAEPDMPWQLSDGPDLINHPSTRGIRPVGRKIEQQALSKHPFFKDSQLVRNPFRCFHRADGCLLTLSTAMGVDYLDKKFSEYLKLPPECLFDYDAASVVANISHTFSETGTSSWHKKTVEWFLVYLMTEIAAAPNNVRQGRNAPTVENAYQAIVQDLKRRRYDRWQPRETVELVRECLMCLDELTAIQLILAKRLDVLRGMQRDLEKFTTEDAMERRKPDNPDGESSQERVAWATMMAKTQFDCYDRLVVDMQQSMHSLFQLRNIEQNELAIISDSQNKAILVFTGVTIVFLPLSFFTSYYGMNLTGIVGTPKTESYFWKVCGSTAFLIVLFITLSAFRHHLKRGLTRKARLQTGMV